MKRIVIVGINTEVGKTVASAIIVKALQANYWKPVQCGVPRDRDWIEEMTAQRCFAGIDLVTPCSPHLAAKKEGLRIEAKNLVPPHSDRPLVIEGTGGILAPLNEKERWFDAALSWKASWILVHRHYLGSLNHFLLTAAFLKEQRVPIAGVIFNGEGDQETEQMLLTQANTSCLGKIPWNMNLTPNAIQALAKAWHSQLLGV